MLYDIGGASAKTATSAKGTRKRTNDHINGGGVDILGFRDTATGAAEDTKGPGLVEDEAEFVAEAEFNLGVLLARALTIR